MTRDKIAEWISYRFPDGNIILADGLEDGFIGIAERCSQPPIAVYDQVKCIKALMKQGMTYECAYEHLTFTFGSWVGDQTPIYLFPFK